MDHGGCYTEFFSPFQGATVWLWSDGRVTSISDARAIAAMRVPDCLVFVVRERLLEERNSS